MVYTFCIICVAVLGLLVPFPFCLLPNSSPLPILRLFRIGAWFLRGGDVINPLGTAWVINNSAPSGNDREEEAGNCFIWYMVNRNLGLKPRWIDPLCESRRGVLSE